MFGGPKWQDGYSRLLGPAHHRALVHTDPPAWLSWILHLLGVTINIERTNCLLWPKKYWNQDCQYEQTKCSKNLKHWFFHLVNLNHQKCLYPQNYLLHCKSKLIINLVTPHTRCLMVKFIKIKVLVCDVLVQAGYLQDYFVILPFLDLDFWIQSLHFSWNQHLLIINNKNWTAHKLTDYFMGKLVPMQSKLYQFDPFLRRKNLIQLNYIE